MTQRKNIWKRADVRLLAIVLGFAFGSAMVAQAQWLGKPGQRDVALGVSGQMAFDARGNGVDQSTGPTVGALLSFHSSYNQSRGFVLNYGYNRMDEDMQGAAGNPYGSAFAPVSSSTVNRNEFTAAYLVKGPKLFWGLHPFALGGGGALLYVPASGTLTLYHHLQQHNPYTGKIENVTYSENLGVSSQTRAAGLFGAGVDWALDKHWGGRLEYRALAFIAPNFQQWQLTSHAYTVSQAPTLSMYYKF